MNRTQYLTYDVAQFRDWLAQCLAGQSINFAVAGTAYLTLADARTAYAWPPRAVAGLPNPHNGYPYIHPAVPRLAANANLTDNAVVLQLLQQSLRSAYAAGPILTMELAGAVAGLLHWGGVYRDNKRGGGNKPWLAANHANLHQILRAVEMDHARGDDQSQVMNLRFNAGMTKVYALLIDDFVIYDSRVAAALGWLAVAWWTQVQRKPLAVLPADLRFGCLPANGKAAGHRNPAPGVIPNLINAPGRHYTWNVRANWLLTSALAAAGTASQFTMLRETEAALFQLGQRVF